MTGGAARIAWTLHQGYASMGHAAWMAVGRKQSTDSHVFQIPTPDPRGALGRTLFRLARAAEERGAGLGEHSLVESLRRLAQPRRYWARFLGREDFGYPGTSKLLDLLPARPELVHLHNLHEEYFDLGYMAPLSQSFPAVLTLHDAWLLSGHCAHSLDCARWENGCGHCPYLGTYPAVRRDATAYNWARKRDIYRQSRLYVAAPSLWLMDRARRSMLAPAIVESRVIPNGVDLEIFRPAPDRNAIREELGVPEGALALLFVAAGLRENTYKDYGSLRRAMEIIAERSRQKVVVLALGGDGNDEILGSVEIRHIPYSQDIRATAKYYQAADIYLHPAKADTFPNAIMEALACGTPVIATKVGGVPEQVYDGETGFLVALGDPVAMARATIQLMEDERLRLQMGGEAASDARKRFSSKRMVEDYLNWYVRILREQQANAS